MSAVLPLIASVLAAGLTLIAVKVAAVTVTVVKPEISPTVAVMVVVPALSVLVEWLLESIVATAAELELHVAPLDTSETEPSENEPVAVNSVVTPMPSVGLVGVTAMETSVALLTVSVADPVTVPTAARIVLVPVVRPVATPALETLATLVLDDVQVAVAVTSCVVPSLSVTTALKGAVP